MSAVCGMSAAGCDRFRLMGMAKYKRHDAPGAVFHVTGRVNWQEWHLARGGACPLVWDELEASSEAFGVSVLAAVLMSNHFHLVAMSPDADRYRRLTSRVTSSRHRRAYPVGHCNATVLAQFMRRFRRTVSVRLHRRLDVTGRFWERRYHARRVKDPWDLTVTTAYDHRNPVRARMVRKPEDYEWSTAAWWGGVGDARAPRVVRLPFDLEIPALRDEVLRYQSTRALDEAIAELNRTGVAWHSEEGRALLASMGVATTLTAA